MSDSNRRFIERATSALDVSQSLEKIIADVREQYDMARAIIVEQTKRIEYLEDELSVSKIRLKLSEALIDGYRRSSENDE